MSVAYDCMILSRLKVLRRSVNINHRFLSSFCFSNKKICSRNEDLYNQPRRYNVKEKAAREKKQQMETKRRKIEAKKRIPTLQIPMSMTLGELADISKRTPEQVHLVKSVCAKTSFVERDHYPLNERLTSDLLACIVKRLGYRPQFQREESLNITEDRDIYAKPVTSDSKKLKPRPPIVAVMGHVDHGKTTILDALRKSTVAASEAGGITQSIGAFSVLLTSNQAVTFIDTPGHSVFTSMRERGAMVTDIVVLVVAADDGVMEQTLESIHMIKMAECKVVVAVNKCDKHDAAPDLVIEDLENHGIKCEQLGGNIPAVKISALKNLGMDKLVETIIATAEMSALTCDPEMQAQGFVLESKVEKGRGNMASLIIKQGKIRVGQVLLAGMNMAKVKLILDTNGKKVKYLLPGEAGNIMGWKTLPSPGQVVLEAETEAQARAAVLQREREMKVLRSDEIWEEVTEKRNLEKREFEEIKAKHSMRKQQVYEFKKYETEKSKAMSAKPSLNVIIKADVEGSLEAILGIIDSYDCDDDCSLKLVSSGVGDLKFSEYELAKEFNAIVFLFNTGVTADTKSKSSEDVTIMKHNVIYHLVESLRELISKRLPLVKKDVVKGEAVVQQVFRIKKSIIAGCMVESGELESQNVFTLIRDGEVLHRGLISSMKRHSTSIGKISSGNECGIIFADEVKCGIEVGDIIRSVTVTEEKQETLWRPPGF